MCAQILWLWARPLTITPHRREDLAQAFTTSGWKASLFSFQTAGQEIEKSIYVFPSLSPHRLLLLAFSWLLGYYGMALNATVGGRRRSWPICYQVRGVSQGASNKLSAVTHVSKHGNFIERSKVIWNKPVPLEKRRSDQMIWKVEKMAAKKVREPFSQGAEGFGVHAAWQNGAKAEREERGVKQINFQHLSSEGNGYPCTGVKEPLHLFSQFKTRKQSNKDIPDEKVTVWHRRLDRAFGHLGAMMKP